jgi:hypothetical protein
VSRDTDVSVTSANAAPLIKYSMLVQMGLSGGGTLYACTGNRFLFDGANSYSPVGHLGGVEPVIEESTLFPRAVKLWLSAVGSANLAEPMTENLFNKPVRMFRALLSDSMTIVGTPQQCFYGYVNKCDVHLADAQKGNYFEIEAESRIRREASSNFYTTENHDQMVSGVYSGDTIFKYVPRILGFQSQWGGQNQSLGGSTPHGGPSTGGGGGGRGR